MLTTNNDKLVPSLWYSVDSGRLSGVLAYYGEIFHEQFETGEVRVISDTPSGHTEVCEVRIFGQAYSFMCTEQEHQKFNDAFALTINCEDQKEIDAYWNYFTQEGSEVQCGWCMDKYGLRWQVLPKNFGELLGRPHAFETMMKQKKIVIAEY